MSMDKPQFYVNAFGDRYLYEVNRGTFNHLGAAAVFQKNFGTKLLAEDILNIVIGTDSGVLVRHVNEQGLPKGTRYLFVELDNLLPIIREALADLELDENITIVGQHEMTDNLKTVRFSDYANIGRIKVIESIGALDAYMGEYQATVADVRQQLDAILWAYNSQLSNPSFIRCQLHNLLEEHVPASILRDSFRGRTAALLGGGPSLDDILPWIAKHQNDLCIFAVSRITRRLHEIGITPHVVASIDPNDVSFDVSKEFLTLDPRVVLAHANHVHPKLLTQWCGRSIYLDRRYPWEREDKTDNISSLGPTVTNTAFGLIRAMGFERVIFGGIDLCYGNDGYSHAKGSNEYDAGPRVAGNEIRVPTNGGGNAETPPDFYTAIKSFGDQAMSAVKQGMRVINPAANAAVIEGVTYQPLETIDLESTGSDPFEVLHATLPPDTTELRLNNVNVMQRELARINGRLRKIDQLAIEALACNEGLFGRNGKTADFKYKKRMDKIERQLDSKFKDVSEIVRLFSARAFLYMPPSDREWTDDEIERAGNTYYTAYRENIGLLLKLVEEAQTRFKSAIEEESENPDFEQLLKQWDKDGVPGRAQVWRYRHPDVATRLSADTKTRFEELDRLFEQTLQARDTGHARRAKEDASLAPVASRMQLLFKQGKRTELTNIVELLRRLSGDEAAELVQLGLGYIVELDGDQVAAFDHYAELIELVRKGLQKEEDDSPNQRLEDALGRMAVITIALEQHEQALLVMQTLADLSPAYQPQYAELLRLSGNTNAAIDVYTHYLNAAPDDLISMLRLGKLYQSIGVKEAAKTAFDYVLEKEPDNKTARSLLDQLDSAA